MYIYIYIYVYIFIYLYIYLNYTVGNYIVFIEIRYVEIVNYIFTYILISSHNARILNCTTDI